MSKLLTEAQVQAYHRDGYVFPIRVMPEEEMAGLRARLEALEAREGGKLSRRTNQKIHLLVPWLNELVRHPRILDAVEDIIGPNIFCWGTNFFTKGPGDGTFVSWHQDATYWGLSHSDIVTAWLAFEPSTVEAGAMQVIPGSHKEQQLPHSDTFSEENLLSRGQEIAVEVDENQAVHLVLRPGEMSLHHVLLVHGSKPNRASHPRIGFAIRYVPTYVHQLSGIKDSATLVRGIDEYGYFEHEQAPRAEFDATAVAHHAAVLERQLQILYAGAEKQKDYGPIAAGR
jgi:non-haem Fe2+, alpha-ketoglutarate-dependent halogenase